MPSYARNSWFFFARFRDMDTLPPVGTRLSRCGGNVGPQLPMPSHVSRVIACSLTTFIAFSATLVVVSSVPSHFFGGLWATLGTSRSSHCTVGLICASSSVKCPLNDPYRQGRTLQLFFRPEPESFTPQDPHRLRDSDISSELCLDWKEGFTPLQVSIVKAFLPVTSAVVLLAKPLDVPPGVSIPDQFIVKLADRRFGYRDQQRPELVWTPDMEPRLRDEIHNLIGPDRSKRIPSEYEKPYPPELPDGPLLEWEGWELEVYVWVWKHISYLDEVLAYRHLRNLQGDCIPRLYGTVRLPILPDTTFLHSIVDFVPGLALELIPGPDMGDLKPGVDITEEVADRVSQRLIDGVVRLRDAYCHHNDLRLPNVVLRNFPSDPWPVIVDFGLASVPARGQPTAEWHGWNDEAEEMRKTLTRDPDHPGWHIGSPCQQHVYERRATTHGYAAINNEIESLPAHVRAAQFERVPNSEEPDARERMLLWRVRPGVRTQDDYIHEMTLLHDWGA